MKKNCIVILALMAFIAAAMFASGVFAATTKSGDVADEMSIKDPLFKQYKKGPVKFSHTKHFKDYKLKCEECHHIFKDGKNVFKDGDKVQKCDECHNQPKKNFKKDGVEMLSLYNAFHKNCRDCHKAAKKGPSKCKECHPSK